MKNSIKKGFGFGLSSGIITTLGLLIGLKSSTESTAVVLGGIITIAVADGLSDALGMHISEESDPQNSKREVWEATVTTFLAKLTFALIFILPVAFLPLDIATMVSIVVGLSLITIFSYFLARQQNISPMEAIFEHLAIALLVIVGTYFIGNWAKGLG